MVGHLAQYGIPTRYCARYLKPLCRPSTVRLSNLSPFSSSSTELKKTGLYDFHLKHKAKMVPFGGYMMPLSYGNVGQVASHHHVRNHAGLFDVGHMVQSMFRGPSALEFLEHLTPSDLTLLAPSTSTLSVLLNEQGGIIDDLVITKTHHSNREFRVVTNAGRRDRDLEWFSKQIEIWNEKRDNGDGVEMKVLEGWDLVALQGPKAFQTLQNLINMDLAPLTFGQSAVLLVNDTQVHVSRGGYTGEDGFEISMPPEHVVHITESLLQDSVQLAGLAARDSLRLEAGMCLYGHDLDEETSPVEAGLSWVIAKGKNRRQPDAFIGAETVIKHLKDGPPRRRVGLIVDGAPAREGAEIYTPEDELIGKITSGIPSPTLSKNIAMGYVKSGWHKKGTDVQVKVRNTMRTAVITPMPFIETKYWRG